jgi:hypothetical protein
MAKGRSEDFKTPICRLSFARGLFEARAQEKGKDPKFGCTLIFSKAVDRTALDKAVRDAIIAEHGEKGLKMEKDGLIRTPFLDGESKQARHKETGDLHAGMGPDVFFIRPQANKDRPPVVRYRSANVPATEEEVYSGCYGFAVLNAFAWYNTQNGHGVSFGIQFFQKTRDGERLSGGGPVNVDKWHEKIEDTGETPATTDAAGLFG